MAARAAATWSTVGSPLLAAMIRESMPLAVRLAAIRSWAPEAARLRPPPMIHARRPSSWTVLPISSMRPAPNRIKGGAAKS